MILIKIDIAVAVVLRFGSMGIRSDEMCLAAFGWTGERGTNDTHHVYGGNR